MKFNTTGRAAWIIAAGLWASAALFPATDAAAQDAAQAPEQPAVGTAIGVAAASDQPVRLHPKKSATKSRKAERQAKAKKQAKAEAAKEQTAKADELKPSQDDSMPAGVANANAQWPNDAKPADTYNMSAKAGTVLSQMSAQPEPPAAAAPEGNADTGQVVASDQLNELDRAAEPPPPLTLAKATVDTPAAPVETVENSKPWEQTSLIGKVFIALGGVLTLASAARMFMA